MKLLAKQGMVMLQKISTFDETVEAAKIISRAIEDGLLDDGGECAEITPEDFMIDAEGKTVGVVVSVRSASPMTEGVFRSGRFVRELTCEGSNVEALHSPLRRARRKISGMIETRFVVPTSAA